MKLKEIMITILLVIILTAQIGGVALAVGETPTYSAKIELVANKTELYRGDDFEVRAKVKDISAGKGIVVLGAVLSYDTSKLELVAGQEVTGLNNWTATINKNDINNIKIILDNNVGYVNSEQEVCSIKFKVKADATESTDTVPSTAIVTVNNVEASGGDGIVNMGTANVTATILKRTISITSEDYKIDNGDYDITKINPNTTITELLGKITFNNISENEISLIDAKDNVISDRNTKIRTGMKLKISSNGQNLTYILIVRGDIDGETESEKIIDENDLAQIKLHYIGNTVISNKVKLKAADYDCDGQTTVNDVALIKLNILGLPVVVE